MDYLDLKSNRERLILDFSELGFENIAVLGHYSYKESKKKLIMHKHIDMVEICFLETGQQNYRVKNKDFLLKGGDILINPPNMIHGSSAFPEEKGSLFWMIIKIPKPNTQLLNLNIEETNLLIKNILNLKNIHFKGTKEIKKLLKNIFLSYNKKNDELRKIEITNYVLGFLLQVIRCGNKTNKKNISVDIDYCCNYIRSNIFKKIYIIELAEKVGLSESRFKHKFKNEIGIPPNEYILREKIKIAKDLMSKNDVTLSNLAYDLGFSTPSYFSTVFKKYEGTTPTKYISMHRSGNLHS